MRVARRDVRRAARLRLQPRPAQAPRYACWQRAARIFFARNRSMQTRIRDTRHRVMDLIDGDKTPAQAAAKVGVTVRRVYQILGPRKPKPRVTDAERQAIARMLTSGSRRAVAHQCGHSR